MDGIPHQDQSCGAGGSTRRKTVVFFSLPFLPVCAAARVLPVRPALATPCRSGAKPPSRAGCGNCLEALIRRRLPC